MTKSELLALSEYQIGICWIEDDKLRLKKSVIFSKVLLWVKWKRYKESQLLSLILKSLAIIKMFWIFASESLRYLKVG